MLSEYEKSIGRLISANDLEMIEYQDAVTGNRVVAIVLVDFQGSIKPIATLVGENENPFASLVPLNDARFNATRWNQSQLTDDQFLRQMGINPIDVPQQDNSESRPQ